jgi:hypothetical protein
MNSMEQSSFWETDGSSNNFTAFIKPKDSLPMPQKPADGSYPEQNKTWKWPTPFSRNIIDKLVVAKVVKY